MRFIPPDDEGFTLRGDKRRLVYKGRRRSHRFTILGDGAFEYDCILEREPESNVISLVMEGAENFDFFRQPDFVPDDFLKGSYAVYLKDTLIGQGTGKLCHIHRPEIIDARGRRCWGDLSIVGNRLCITIPEKWLSEAAYPVIVDPTVGTTTIGSQTTGPDPNNKYYDRPWLDNEYTVNKYQVPQNGNGVCTAYVYCYNDDTDSRATPILYTNENNKPYKKKSKNENDINVGISTPTWRNNTFTLDGNISAGDYIWFGIHSSWFTTKFDYGGECYKGWFPWDIYEEYDGEPTPYIIIGPYDTFCTIKWSMYFTYTAVTTQNYVRTLTQGVTLTDSRKGVAEYKRNATQAVNGTTVLLRSETFIRQCLMNVTNSMGISRLPVFTRNVFEQIKITDGLSKNRGLSRTCNDTAVLGTTTNRQQGFYREIKENLKGTDNTFYPVLFVRTVQETQSISDIIHKLNQYICGLYEDVGITSETTRQGEFYRTENETVNADGSVFRGLFIFIRILTTSIVRDFVLRRFLIAREELVLKSCITRELTLDSKIN